MPPLVHPPRKPMLEHSPIEALRTLAFWSVALMFAARHFVTGSVALFLVPLLQERGMSLGEAATVLSLMALIGMPGRVGFAWLGDRMDKRAVIGLCLVFQSAGLMLFTALKRRGVPARLLYFQDEGHWVLKPRNRKVWWENRARVTGALPG